MSTDIVRRAAERGLKKAQRWAAPPTYPEYEDSIDLNKRKVHQQYVDIFQHILDELERVS